MPDQSKACYPTEAQRAAAYHSAQEERERPACEAARVAAANQEAARQAEWQAEKQHRADAEQAARDEQDRKRAEWVAEADRKDAAKAAAAAALHAKALDKAYAGPAISAIMCSIEGEERDLHAQLARENKIAATGGVSDLRAKHDIAEQLVDDADELEGWLAALARYGATRASCKSVANVEPCHSDLTKCEGATRDVAAVWASELDTLWGSEKVHLGR